MNSDGWKVGKVKQKYIPQNENEEEEKNFNLKSLFTVIHFHPDKF